MCRTDNIKTGIFQESGIAPLQRIGHGIADERKILMTVTPDKRFVRLVVEIKSIGTAKFSLANAGTYHPTVDRFTIF